MATMVQPTFELIFKARFKKQIPDYSVTVRFSSYSTFYVNKADGMVTAVIDKSKLDNDYVQTCLDECKSAIYKMLNARDINQIDYAKRYPYVDVNNVPVIQRTHDVFKYVNESGDVLHTPLFIGEAEMIAEIQSKLASNSQDHVGVLVYADFIQERGLELAATYIRHMYSLATRNGSI